MLDRFVTSKFARTSGKLLTLSKSALTNNTDYVLTCAIANIRYCGSTTASFTTKRNAANATINVNFTVTPSNGTAYSTNFTFNTTRPKNISAANYSRCNFGYLDTKLNEYVVLNTDVYSKNPSAANESFIT